MWRCKSLHHHYPFHCDENPQPTPDAVTRSGRSRTVPAAGWVAPASHGSVSRTCSSLDLPKNTHADPHVGLHTGQQRAALCWHNTAMTLHASSPGHARPKPQVTQCQGQAGKDRAMTAQTLRQPPHCQEFPVPLSHETGACSELGTRRHHVESMMD